VKPRLLDLFCGEGGAGMGYHHAGFEVVGVDNAPARLRHYPFECHEGDAIAYLLQHGHEYDAIHASPPCTGYSRGTAAIPDRLTRYDRLIAATREALEIVGKPYVIENVADARPELRDPVLLCGRQFGLTATDDDGTPLVMDRHRLFECAGFPVMVPEHVPHDPRLQVAGVYGGARRDKHEARYVRKGAYVPPNLEVLRKLIGAPWMTQTGCFLSIPPVYTEHIGAQLIAHINQETAA
jgi:DNA (cytosine-5)-methyltransferase 1